MPALETIWSEIGIWDADSRSPLPEGGGKPIAGDTVFIPAGWNCTLDEDTEILDYLEINGNLTFDPTKDITLKAKRIFIRDGILISGSAEAPTTFKHEIHLYGELEDEHLVFDGTLAAGNKVLAVTGQLDMYGLKKKSWTKLATNAYPDDSIIFTEDT